MAKVEVFPPLPKPPDRVFVLTLSEGEALAVYASIGLSDTHRLREFIKRHFNSELRAEQVESLELLYHRLVVELGTKY